MKYGVKGGMKSSGVGIEYGMDQSKPRLKKEEGQAGKEGRKARRGQTRLQYRKVKEREKTGKSRER
jgi:hypothetical protein